MGRSWSLRNSGPSFVFLNFRNMRTDTMAATTTNADTSPARSGSVDTLLSRNPRKKENREWERELYSHTFWKIICKYCVFCAWAFQQWRTGLANPQRSVCSSVVSAWRRPGPQASLRARCFSTDIMTLLFPKRTIISLSAVRHLFISSFMGICFALHYGKQKCRCALNICVCSCTRSQRLQQNE